MWWLRMDTQAKIDYNKRSAIRYGWIPPWFGVDEFSEQLVKNILDFQKEHDLEPDGLCGSMTYSRVMTEREANEDTNYITCNGENVVIDWDKTISLTHENSKVLPATSFKKVQEHGKATTPVTHWESVLKPRNPTMIVTHWDAALSADSCYKILKKRGISSHFVIDNDGTIYQMVDTQNIAWHAGIRSVNEASIGIDFTNAYYTKYQNWYERKGFGPRPVLEGVKMHGRTLDPFLGYYPVQIDAYRALVKGLCKHYDIKLECPLDEHGELLSTVDDSAAKGQFEGVVGHYHLTRRKKDTAGLELKEILEDIKIGG